MSVKKQKKVAKKVKVSFLIERVVDNNEDAIDKAIDEIAKECRELVYENNFDQEVRVEDA